MSGMKFFLLLAASAQQRLVPAASLIYSRQKGESTGKSAAAPSGSRNPSNSNFSDQRGFWWS
jgi:hypothetical protein